MPHRRVGPNALERRRDAERSGGIEQRGARVLAQEIVRGPTARAVGGGAAARVAPLLFGRRAVGEPLAKVGAHRAPGASSG